MSGAPSPSHSRTWTIILLVLCALVSVGAIILGVDDNPPGILLAFLGGTTFVLAFTHPWRSTWKFLYLLLTSVLGFVLFMVLSIIIHASAANLAASPGLQKLVDSPVYNAVNIIFIMLCAAALLVGVIGSLVISIRSRREKR